MFDSLQVEAVVGPEAVQAQLFPVLQPEQVLRRHLAAAVAGEGLEEPGLLGQGQHGGLHVEKGRGIFNLFYILIIVLFNTGIVYQINMVNYFVIVLMRVIRGEELK